MMKDKKCVSRILSLLLVLCLVLPLVPARAAEPGVLPGEADQVLTGQEDLPDEELLTGIEAPQSRLQPATRVPEVPEGRGHVISVEVYRDGVGQYLLEPVRIDFGNTARTGAIQKAFADCGIPDIEVVEGHLEPHLTYIDRLDTYESDRGTDGDYVNSPHLAQKTWMVIFNNSADQWKYGNWDVAPDAGVELAAPYGVLRFVYTEYGGSEVGVFQEEQLTVNKDTLLRLIAEARQKHPTLEIEIANAETVALNGAATEMEVYNATEVLHTAMEADPDYQPPEPDPQEPQVPHIERIKIDGPYRRTAMGGERIQFTVTKTPADAVEEVWWEVDYENIGTIDSQSGEFTALRGGDVTVVAHCGWALPQTAVVTVINPAETVEIWAGEEHVNPLNIVHDRQLQLKAVTDPDGTSDPIVWSSDNESVAKVDSKGLLTAVRKGTATIRVEVGKASDTLTVNVLDVPAAGVTLSQDEVSVKEAGTVTVTASVTPSDCTDELVWSVDDPWIAQVKDGTIKGLHPGETVVTATAGEFSASVKVVVREGAVVYFEYADGRPDQKIDVTNDTITLSTTDVGRFRVSGADQGYWFDNSVEIVDPEGLKSVEYIVREDGSYNPYDVRRVRVTAVFDDMTAKDFYVNTVTSGITELRVKAGDQIIDNASHLVGRTGDRRQITVEGRRTPEEDFFVVPQQAVGYRVIDSSGMVPSVSTDGVVTLRSGTASILVMLQENFDVCTGIMVDALPWQVNAGPGIAHGLESLRQQSQSRLGDENVIFALCRAGEGISPENRTAYLDSVRAAFRARTALTQEDYAKIILTMTVLGQDPQNFDGINLLEKLCTLPQGDAAMSAWTLIALDSYLYDVPGSSSITRDSLIDTILASPVDADIFATALSMQALTPYRDREAVQQFWDAAHQWLITRRTEYAGFRDGVDENSRMISQVIIALCEARLDPVNPDNGMTAAGTDIVSHVMKFDKNNGYSCHTAELADPESTWNVVLALESYRRMIAGGRRLYDLRDVAVNIPAESNQARADAVADQIGRLPDPVTLENEPAVRSARRAYNELTEAQKALVSNYSALEVAEKRIGELRAAVQLEADQKAAQKVIDQIAALKVESLEDRPAVEAARQAYNELTRPQKELVNAANYSLLTQAEQKLADMTEQTEEEKNRAAAKQVDSMIAALDVSSIDDRAAVKAARQAYNDLTVDQKKYVTKLGKLNSSEKLLAEMIKFDEDQKAAQRMNEILDNLQVKSLADKPAVEAARAYYETLTQDQKNRVANRGRLDEAERKIKELEKLEADKAEAKVVEDRIAALKVERLEDCPEVHATRMAYKSLTAAQRRLVSPEALQALEAAEQKAAELEAVTDDDTRAAKAVEDQIAALKATEDLAKDKEAAAAARKAYEALTEAQKQLVPNLKALEKFEEELKDREKPAEDPDKTAAKAVEDQIAALKTDSYAQKPAAEAARRAYEALTETQKALISNYEALTAAEKAFADMEASAAEVQKKIEALDVRTLKDKAAVAGARSAYDGLSPELQALVTNVEKLLAAEQKLEELEEEASRPTQKPAEPAKPSGNGGKGPNKGGPANTGDQIPVGLLVTVAVLSGAAILAVILLGKKRKK